MNDNSYAYFAVWNMNGGPLPQSVFEAVSEAVETAVNKAQGSEKDNVRILWAATNRASGEPKVKS